MATHIGVDVKVSTALRPGAAERCPTQVSIYASPANEGG